MKPSILSVILLSLVTVTAACGGSESAGATEPTQPTPVEPTASTAMLGTGEVTIFIEGNEGIKLHADGRVEANMDGAWREVAMIKEDSIIASGKTMVSVDSEGNVNFTGGPQGIKFNGASVDFGGQSLAIGDDGVVTGLNPGAEGKVRVEGATDEATKRTALVMILGVFISAKGEAGPATAEPVAEPDTEPDPDTP